MKNAMADSPLTMQCLEVTAAAAAAYLQDSAAQFASELWTFVASGLSVQAHDRLVFGAQDCADRQRSAEAPMNAEGSQLLFATIMDIPAALKHRSR